MKTCNYFKHIYIWIKRTLALTMLCCLAIASSKAQNETCRQIGSGSSENLDFPISGALSRSYLQQIYKASELQEEDIDAGDNISALAFNYFSETPTTRPIKIYLGNTSATALFNEWISINDLTLVFSSNCQEFSKGEDNWTKISLDTEFPYSGGNIVVAILMNKEDATDIENCFTNSNSNKRFYTHNGGLGISRFVKDGLEIPITFNEDGLPKTNEYLVGNSLQNRNNIKFCKIASSCPKVSSINATSIAENSITLDWTNGSSETAWTIEYANKGFTLGEGITLEVTEHPYEITNLSATTEYDFYVRAICGENNESAWAGPKNYSTSCGTINSENYLEEFTANSSSLDCWTIIDVDQDGSQDGTGKWHFYYGYARYAYHYDNAANDWLISPKISITGKMSLSFDYKSSSYPEKFSVWAIPGNSPENYESAINLLPTQEVTVSDFITIPSISLLDYQDQEIYIGIKCESNENEYYFYIDNFSVHLSSEENDITGFSIPTQIGEEDINTETHEVNVEVAMTTELTNLTPTITISEKAQIDPASGISRDFSEPVTYSIKAENEDIQEWTVRVSNSSVPQTDKDILAFTFTGIEGQAEIDNITHKISATSSWENPVNSLKPEIEISFMASISPESGTTQDFTNVFIYTVTAEDGSTQEWEVTIVSTEAPIGGNCENPVVLDLSSLPNPHTITGETTQGFGNVYSNTDLNLYDNGPDKLYKLSVSENASYSIKMTPTSSYAGMGLFQGCPSENVLIKKDQFSSSIGVSDLNIDNAILQTGIEYFLMADNYPSPPCIESYNLTFTKDENQCSNPLDLSISDILQTSVKVNWSQILNENNWELKYSEQGFNPEASGTLITENVTSPYELTGLTQNTNYSIHIRSKCSDTEYSQWSEPVNFSTLESCPTPTDISFSEVTINSAEITWNGYTATNWILEYRLNTETEYQSVEVSTNSYSLSNLLSSGIYKIQIKAICPDNEESNYSEIATLLTNCESFVDIPYIEDFESYGAYNSDAFPNCWRRPISNLDTYGTIYPSIYGSTSGILTNSLKFKSEENTPTIACTPIFAFDLEDLVLDFILRREGQSSGNMTIGLMTDPSDPSTFSEITTISPNEYTPKQYIIKLSDYNISGVNKSIAFKHSSYLSYYYYWLDDVKIREKMTNKDIIYVNSSDMYEPGTINNEEHSVSCTISFYSDITQQSPSILISENATISPESESTHDFTNSVTYTITAEDGSSQDWQITLIKPESPGSEKEILNFTFPSQVGDAIIDSENATITAIAEWNANLSSISPSIEISQFASIIPAPNTAQDFSSQVEYTVKAEDETEKIWTVTISLEETYCSNAIESPFFESFLEDSPSLDCWTIIDNNNDGISSGTGKWNINGNSDGAFYTYSYTSPADDWLVSPKIKIPADANLRFNYKTGSSWIEKFSVYVIQSSPSDIENAINILSTTSVENSTWQSINPISLSEYAEQEIHIAIRCESDANQYYLHIIDFAVSSGDESQFKITSSAGENGSILPLGITFVNEGEDMAYTITPNENYQIDKVMVDGIDKTSDLTGGNTYTFTQVNAHHSIVALFKTLDDDSFIINASVQGGNGSIEPAGEVDVQANQDQSFTITPNENYQIDKVLVDGIDKSSQLTNGNTYTFTQVNADHSIVAKFKALDDNSFKINASVQGGNGSIEPDGEVSVQPNQDQSFTITPNENYQIDKVLVDNTDKTSELTEGNTYTFTQVNADHSIVAKFKVIDGNSFTIIASVDGGNGNISPSGSLTIIAGESQSFIITPNTNYIIDKVIVDNTDKTNEINDNTYTFNNVQANHTIKAKFKPALNTYQISCSVYGGNGAISPANTTVMAGDNLEININPFQGYILDKLIDNLNNMIDVVVDNKYKLTNIQEDHNIVARFEIDNKIIEEDISEIHIYPNPTKDILNIETSIEISIIEITSLDGKLIYKQNINNNKCQYKTKELAEGNYIIRIYTIDNNQIIRQFSVSR